MTDSSTSPDEYFEHIPWDELMAEVDSRRRATLRWAAGAAVAVVVLGAFWALRGPSDPPVTVPPTALPPASTAPPVPVTAPSTVTTVGRTWAEADLRAVAPVELERRAATYAEWVLRDLFTRPRVDRYPGDAPDASPDARSFVEWVSVVSVTELDAGRFRVEALLGRLGAKAGEEYRRIPPEGFVVVVDLSSDPPSIVDLPTPVPPTLPEFADVGGEPATPPGPVAEAAGEIFGRFGTVEGVEAFRVGPHWRLVGSVTDPAGVRWPLVVWLDDAGRQVDPAR